MPPIGPTWPFGVIVPVPAMSASIGELIWRQRVDDRETEDQASTGAADVVELQVDLDRAVQTKPQEHPEVGSIRVVRVLGRRHGFGRPLTIALHHDGDVVTGLDVAHRLLTAR